MQRVVVLFLAVAVLGAPGQAAAQATSIAPADLAATWQLVSLERGLSNEKPERNQQPRGLLILDSAGNVFEWVGTNPRQEPDAPTNDPVKALADYSGFWGRYRVDTAQKRMVFNARGAVSPNVSAREFSRTVERSGDRLILTSIDEPHSRGGTRWSYERIPPIEAPGPTFQKAVGFWEYVVEKRTTTAGEVLSEQKRGGPSTIVYTPAGYVGVHFLPINKMPTPFAGDVPTPEEARAAVQGYIGYYGSLTVYPGQVFHNLMSAMSNVPGTILRRFAVFSQDGNELNVNFAPARDQQGRMVVTSVTLRRISGEAEMLGNNKK
jgi:Lipocalin-like domain